MSDSADNEIDPIADHRRSWRSNLYVYPVISRRARGLSIGINLNPDQVCNFDCVYCEVHRTGPAPRDPVDLNRLAAELEAMLALAQSGEIWTQQPFDSVPPRLRRINDIAFSGDGEPTGHPNFAGAVEIVAAAKARAGLDEVKIVLITNATLLHTAGFGAALATLLGANGQIWAKLDAGTPAWYRRMNRSRVPFGRVLTNLAELARQTPIVIQTMFLAFGDMPVPAAEIEAYLIQLRRIIEGGGRLSLVQAYTIARPPAEGFVRPLSNAQLDAIAERIRTALPELPVETFYSQGA